MAENKKIQAWVDNGGALMVSKDIPGITQKLAHDTAKFYGGENFVCETIRASAGKAIADSMGWEFVEKRP